MSSNGYEHTTAPKSSGRWVMAAPTSRPPFEPPEMASLDADVYLLTISHSAAAMKSSKTFCFLSSIPARCHDSPNSPPPRRLASAKTPPFSIQVTARPEKPGSELELNPP